MIRESEVFKIGYIAKHRGLRGEVELSFTDDCFDTGSAEYLVLDMDGILVPFFWEEYRFKNDDTAIIKFEDVDTDGQARRLVGHSVYYPKRTWLMLIAKRVACSRRINLLQVLQCQIKMVNT